MKRTLIILTTLLVVFIGAKAELERKVNPLPDDTSEATIEQIEEWKTELREETAFYKAEKKRQKALAKQYKKEQKRSKNARTQAIIMDKQDKLKNDMIELEMYRLDLNIKKNRLKTLK